MTNSANGVAMRAIRGLLEAAHPFTATIGGKAVAVTVSTGDAAKWKPILAGLDEKEDGPWPRVVTVNCTWPGGAYKFRMDVAWYSRQGRYKDDLCLHVGREGQQLVWINLALAVRKASAAEVVIKGRAFGDEDIYDALQDLLTEANLPLVTKANVRLGVFDRSSGEVAEVAMAFRRVVELALIKHTFLDAKEIIRRGGSPLVDVKRWPPLTLDRLAGMEQEATEAESVAREDREEDDQPPPDSQRDLNVILYGPPGTGKTFALGQEYMPRFTRAGAPAATDELGVEHFKWWEVLALALKDGPSSVPDLAVHPLVVAKYRFSAIRTAIQPVIWGALQLHTVETSKTVNFKRRSGVLLFEKSDDGTWRLDAELPDELEAKAEALRKVPSANETTDYTFVSFHQAYSYEDFIEGIRPRVVEDDDEEPASVSYELRDGVFKRAARDALALAGVRESLEDFCRLPRDARRKAFETPAPGYALFIDEINRGNVARVFGELITLLEPDKRLGAEHEVIVRLPYSEEKFGVPPNLYVIGTMNTADRGVEALDIALRRRFVFRELMPDLDFVPDAIADGLNPRAMLRAINQRLELLLDRDHVIGHAYFAPLRTADTLDTLRAIFANKIVPLLQEYFFGDLGKIGLVLGHAFVSKRTGQAVTFARFDHPDREALGERSAWDLARVDTLPADAFRAIYAD